MPVTTGLNRFGRWNRSLNIMVQVRDHEYAPWTDFEVFAEYDGDDLGFVYLKPGDGTGLRPVHRSNVRQRNADRRPRSLDARWIPLPR